MRLTPRIGLSAALVTALAGLTSAQQTQASSIFDFTNDLQTDYYFEENEQGIFAADQHGTYAFASFQEYVQSSFFLAHGLRCGADRVTPQIEMLGTTADCTNSNTTIKAEYNASGGLTYTIPIWVHEIRRKTGTLGTLVAGQVTSQIASLNDLLPYDTEKRLADLIRSGASAALERT